MQATLTSIETLVAEALLDMEISPKEFVTILNEKDKYEKMKEYIRTIESSDEDCMFLSCHVSVSE